MIALPPFDHTGPLLKGNIHTHSTCSDGALPPQEVVRRYKAAGYDFLSMTDHFLARFDFPLTDISTFADEAFTPIRGAELHAPRTEMSDLWHLVAVGLPQDFAPTGADEDGPALARRAHEAGAFIGIAHPAWYELSLDDAETLVEYCHAVEIYNHGCHLMHDKGDGAYMLDGLADKGHRLLTYACDDAHFKAPDFGGGWIHLRATDRSQEAILAALKDGSYYSSQGPQINMVTLTDEGIVVECSPAAGVVAIGRGYQYSFQFGQGLSRVVLPRDGLKDSPWMRLIVTDAAGKRAWTNPHWF